MERILQVEARRQALVQEMLDIRSLRRGTITQQHLKVRQRRTGRVELRGPYYVLSRRKGGRTVSCRLRQEELEQIRRDVAQHRRFVHLCQEFEDVTEQLGQLERQAGPEGPGKKRRNSP